VESGIKEEKTNDPLGMMLNPERGIAQLKPVTIKPEHIEIKHETF